MRTLSLCDGLGGAYLALNELGVEFSPVTGNTYYAVEIDKHARSIADSNLPNIIRAENDVTKINRAWIKKHGPFDLVTFGSPCFVAGSKVLTDKGYLPIEEISVGDKVLTHNGRFKKVLRIGGKVSHIRAVKIEGHREIFTTDEHPFLCKSVTRKNISGRTVRLFTKENWIKAKDLTRNTFCKHAFIKNKKAITCNVSPELAWLMGRYLADGHLRISKRTEKGREHTNQYQLILSVGSHKIEEVKKQLPTISYSLYKHSKSVHRVVISNKKLVELFHSMGFGVGASNKNIPMEVFKYPIDIREKLLNGYLSGDGNYSKEKGFSCNSVSENLILGLQLLVNSIYGVKANYSFFKRPPKTIIEGREVNQKDTHLLRFKNYKTKQAKYYKDKEGIYSSVKINKRTGEKSRVYNLEVEGDNTYTVNNVVVHNCQSLSNLGKRKGLEGKSRIFLDCIRVLRTAQELNPKLKFLIENVKMQEKFKKEFDNYIGSEGLLVNSNTLCAQNRERYYWSNFEMLPPRKISAPISKVIEAKGKDVDNIYAVNYSSSSRYIDDNGRVWSAPKEGRKLRTDRRLYFTHKANTLVTGVGCSNNKSGTKVVEVKFLSQYDNRPAPKIPSYGILYYHEGTDLVPAIYNALECREYDFIVRALTIREAARLQTIPDTFKFTMVSPNQAYKAIGNGWTIKVITHLLKQGLTNTK